VDTVTATVTDLFCGAGGSSLGAASAGLELVMAANHWSTAIDVHQAHFPEAAHDCADITQVDPRRYPRTDILLASPECTNHSQARGVSRKQQDPTLWDAPDPAAERSRATMWDVCRFAEQMRYDAIVVENVVEATKWVGWRGWSQTMADLGYERRILSHNSMHHGVPQSRDRIYVVFWRRGLRPDLELEQQAWCPRCDATRTVRQAWKNDRTVGRYRQQWHWACTTCGATAEPSTSPAADIIDWDLDCPRIGDRRRPLAAATRARILAGLQRYGWAPVITAGAGHVWEGTPGMRARPVHSAPLPVQGTTAQHALATPPPFLLQTAHGGRVHELDRPHPTVCASDDRLALVVRSNGFTGSGQQGRFSSTTEDPLPTLVTTQRPALVVTNRRHHTPRPVAEPLTTICAGGNHHGLLMRNNGGGAEMVTPTDEPARTVTTKGHQSLLVPYNGTGQAKRDSEPLGTQPTRDRWALVDPDQIVDDCGFRMLEPHEIAAAMAFPDGYIPTDLTKRDRVKLAGNAVTPPVMTWITGRLLQALEAAS
jgi:DNA (cytosine-5)-methyltransferase 1